MHAKSQLKDQIVKAKFKFDPGNIPDKMKSYDQWVTWSLVQDPRKDKITKNPTRIIRKGQEKIPVLTKWGDPDHLMSFHKALEAYKSNPDVFAGLGFVFTDDDPFVFIDLDNIYPMDLADESKAKANGYINMAEDTFIEFSQSEKGVHIITEGYFDKFTNTKTVEMYKNQRFVAMTGKLLPKAKLSISNNQAVIDAILTDHDIELGIEEGPNGAFEIPDLIPTGARNDLLYRACWSLYAKGLRDEQLEEAFAEVVERCEDPIPDNDSAWSFPERVANDHDVVTRRKQRTASRVNLIDRYAFIPELNKFYDFEFRACYSPEALNGLHADTHTGRDGILKAAPRILSSPNKTVCRGLIWMPMQYGKEQRIVKNEGEDFANTWAGFPIDPIPGDVSPWLKVLEHLYPVKEHRNNVIRRMAFDVQHPDQKCNWHIVNYGIQGAGKDLALYPLSRIFGSAFSTVGDQEIKSDYDDGFVKKKIVEVNEVMGLNRNSLEKVKQRCTSEGSKWMQLNPKKESKITVPNLWSLYFNTNHSDAMHINVNERRFYILRCDKPMSSAFSLEEIDEIATWIKHNDFSPNHVMSYLMNVDLTGFDIGNVPEKTDAFYSMCDLVKSDIDDSIEEWIDQEDGPFKYKFVHPELIVHELSMSGVKTSKRVIKVWLEKNGWTKMSKDFRGQKFGAKPKSIGYYFKDQVVLNLKPSELWEAIDREETERGDLDLDL